MLVLNLATLLLGLLPFLKTPTTIRITFYTRSSIFTVWFTPYFYFVLSKFFKCGFQTLNWFHDPLMSLSSRFEQLLQTRLGAPLLRPTVWALTRLQRIPGAGVCSPVWLNSGVQGQTNSLPQGWMLSWLQAWPPHSVRPAVGCWAGHCSSLSPLPQSLGVGARRASPLRALQAQTSCLSMGTIYSPLGLREWVGRALRWKCWEPYL